MLRKVATGVEQDIVWETSDGRHIRLSDVSDAQLSAILHRANRSSFGRSQAETELVVAVHNEISRRAIASANNELQADIDGIIGVAALVEPEPTLPEESLTVPDPKRAIKIGGDM